jgi:ankyrin repeat protein
VSKGADLDTANSYGDSPLEAAVETRHMDVAAFLKAHGASQIRGTPEQRQAASAVIVRRNTERNKGR